MKISTTQDGKVTFSGMHPGLAEALLDLAEDLNSGSCVLLYGPEYIPVVRPTDRLKNELDRMLHADVRMLGGLNHTWEDGSWFESTPLLEETHIQAWNEVFPNDPTPTTDQEPGS